MRIYTHYALLPAYFRQLADVLCCFFLRSFANLAIFFRSCFGKEMDLILKVVKTHQFTPAFEPWGQEGGSGRLGVGVKNGTRARIIR